MFKSDTSRSILISYLAVVGIFLSIAQLGKILERYTNDGLQQFITFIFSMSEALQTLTLFPANLLAAKTAVFGEDYDSVFSFSPVPGFTGEYVAQLGMIIALLVVQLIWLTAVAGLIEAYQKSKNQP